MLLLMTVLTLLTIFVVWIPFGSSNIAALYVVAFFMGIGTGSFVPLGGMYTNAIPICPLPFLRRSVFTNIGLVTSGACLSHLCDGRGYGKWLGSCYAIVSFA